MTLIAMVLILLSTVALIRSFDTSLSMAGNLAFKRDLVNQGERGMAKAIALFTSANGALASSTARESNSLANNYSATALATDGHGIPLALLNDTTFTAAGMSGSDITDSTSGISVRYVIDRLCNATGEFNASSCVSANIGASRGGSASKLKKSSGQMQAIYRISVRVTGPRNTQSYMQTTMTR